MRRKVFSLVFLLFASTISVAQSATTWLRGTVTDRQYASVVGAQVTLSDPATSFTRAVKTDTSGQYHFLQIPPGPYNVTVTAPGFGKTTEQAVRLVVSTPSTLNVTLKVQAATTVEVSGEVALINTQDATIGNAITAARIQALPFEGRDPAGILSLQPGVVFVGKEVDPGFDSRSGSVSGARSDQTNITLDGIDNNNQTQGTAFEGALRATLDSLQEFRVTTSNSNAEAGRSSGAQVNLVTKSGTNNFHGTLYEYHRPTFTTANNWFNKRAQIAAGLENRPGKLLRNTFGGTVGGPIIKDRVFFFGAYEGHRRAESNQITRVVPSEFLRRGIIRYVNDSGGITALQPSDLAAMDPGCSANGTCPLGPGPNPAVLAIWQKYPLPNTDAVGDGLNFRGFTFPGPTPGTLATYIAKFDFNLTRNGNHRVFVRGGLQGDKVTAQRDPVVAQTGDGGPQFPGLPANITERNNSRGLVAAYTALLTPAIINNFRYGFIRQGTESVGLKTQAFNHWRGLDNPFGFNTSTRGHVPVHNFVDDVTWTKGRHTLQFGGNARVINNLRTSDSTSFFTTSSNVSWLDNASISGSGSSLDPGAFGFPNVADSFSNN